MKPRGNTRQLERADIPRLWCSWGRHEVIPLSNLKEQFPAGTMCLQCQLAIIDNVKTVIALPEMSVAMYRRERIKREKVREAVSFERVMKTKAPESNGIVYYMRINDQIKIGYTANLTQRSRTYPPGTELLAVEPAGAYTERDRHQQFQKYRVRGREWFDPSDELMAHIADLARQYDVPTHLMHKFTTRRGT